MQDSYKWKIVMMGDFAVGKTSLVRRFVYDEFSDSYLTTIGVKVTKKDLILEQAVISLLIWDIAGSDRFNIVSPEYIKGARGGIIVADVTRESTIESIQTHIDFIHSVNPEAVIAVALNKSDLVEENPDKLALIEQMKSVIGLKGCHSCFLTSAKKGENVEELFNTLADKIKIGIR